MFSTVVLEGASSSSLKCDGNAVCVERDRFAVDAAFEAGTEPEAILDCCGIDFDACLRGSQQSLVVCGAVGGADALLGGMAGAASPSSRVQLGQPGLLQHAVGRLFANAHGAGMRQFRLRVSVLELRGERLDDLLAESKLSNASVRHGHAAEIVGAVSCPVITADEAAQLVAMGRASAGRDVELAHALIVALDVDGADGARGRCLFVDLSGWAVPAEPEESARRRGAPVDSAPLRAFVHVVDALVDEHWARVAAKLAPAESGLAVPWRRTRLTRLLRPSVEGGGLALVCVVSTADDVERSCATLSLARAAAAAGASIASRRREEGAAKGGAEPPKPAPGGGDVGMELRSLLKRQADLLRVVGEMAPDVLQRATTKVLSAEMEGVDLQAPPHIELNDGEVWVDDSLATSTAQLAAARSSGVPALSLLGQLEADSRYGTTPHPITTRSPPFETRSPQSHPVPAAPDPVATHSHSVASLGTRFPLNPTYSRPDSTRSPAPPPRILWRSVPSESGVRAAAGEDRRARRPRKCSRQPCSARSASVAACRAAAAATPPI